MLSAVCAQGQTTITNAAREPEIVDLQNFLRCLGADVQGAGQLGDHHPGRQAPPRRGSSP